MWVQYKRNGLIKKFSISIGDETLKTITDKKGFVWELVEEEPQESQKKMILSGFAVLILDSISGKRQWATFAADGSNHTNYPPMTPLVFPTEIKLPLGARIEIHVPAS